MKPKLTMFAIVVIMASIHLGHAGPVVSVLEYTAVDSCADPVDCVWSNLDNYDRFVLRASELGTDILVFPEYGLTGMHLTGYDMARRVAQTIPDDFPPCQMDVEDDVLNQLSCLAVRSGMYLVVNLLEQVSQPDDCSLNDKPILYNTVVAFGRAGRIVAKYRKFHLHGETFISKPETASLSYFDTDVGLRVGLIICFDINYPDPALQLLQTPVDVIAFPSAWFDELPFLTAPQYHSGWSRAWNTTILASGHHYPATGTLGSGIYTGYGTLNMSYSTDSGSRLVSANLYEDTPIDTWHNSGDAPGMIFREDLSSYEMTPLPPGVLTISLSQKDQSGSKVECRLEYSLSTENSDLFLVARSGMRTFGGGKYHAGIQVCGVIYCPGGSACHWNNEFDQKNHFKWIHLSGTFDDDVRPMPMMLSGKLNPVIPPSMAYTRRSNEFMLKSQKEVVDLFSLGLYGRNYRLDP